MRASLLFLPCLTLLCGFATAPFDADAVPKANQARKQALDACNARKDFKSTAEVIGCIVDADRAFAHAVRLIDSRPLDNYTAAIKTLDDGIAAGTVKPADVAKNFHDIQNGFFKALNGLYVDYESTMAQDYVAQSKDQDNGMRSGGMNSMDNMGGMGMNGM
jgi:hypothetical protein